LQRARFPVAVTATESSTIAIGGDLRVQRPGLGTLELAGPGALGDPADREGAKTVLRRALELGVNFIDTADTYGPEVSERIVAEALYPYPSGLVIATKGGMVRSGPPGAMWPADGRPEHLRAACHGSLRRLRLERIELYQLHTVDPAVPVEESLGALATLQAEGKIHHIGVSNVSIGDLERARTVAPVVSVQNRFNLSYRPSADVLGVCEREGIAFIPWQPLGLGRHGRPDGPVARVAAARRATTAQIAVAWLLQRSSSILPIPGTSSVAHLEENLEAAHVELTADDIAKLEREIPPFDPDSDLEHPPRSPSAQRPART
jgi:aryl-alcohol dehydrogenase-like predicted oxidoreductase